MYKLPTEPECSSRGPSTPLGMAWTRLHIHYAGSFLGKMFLITVDAYSKWIDVQIVSNSTSYMTIEH